MKYKILFLIVLFCFVSCDESYKTPDEISEIEMDLNVKRLDQDLLNVTKETVGDLKKKYPFLEAEEEVNADSIWLAQKHDTLQVQLSEESLKAFPDFDEEAMDLSLLFKHIKYYFPEFKKPEIITLTTGVDYRNKIDLNNGKLFVAVDTYLGADHKFYGMIPNYITSNMDKEQLTSDVAEVYARRFTIPGKQRMFIDQMVYFGKVLYLKDLFVPFKSEASRIGYSKEQLEWAKANESEIWSYFVERKMLFSTESELSSRFIALAPFSKFYLELDNESPGMVGRYIGWQIVRSFMKKNDVSLRELSAMSGEEIFNKSKYKPAK